MIMRAERIKILEGPLEDKRGITKQIYKGVIFFHYENESENCGCFCAKAQICEQMNFLQIYSKERVLNQMPIFLRISQHHPSLLYHLTKLWKEGKILASKFRNSHFHFMNISKLLFYFES
ncbi:hypothetical protein L1987_00778 [Smallanthus sonchifolius]|uniref:Uncharacterized protein n=1 Tax=Smallanthus sonchifolius TaxID=185202 RepID=A0ACB9K329_9ASTR|nr:hypothetical protein L1987_00778 [Smallanthus sonchifolius]